MHLGSLVVVFLLSTSVTAAPAEPALAHLEDPNQEDDPLETSESGHFRRRRVWRKLLKNLVGLGAYGLGTYGLGGYGLGGNGHGGHGLKEGHTHQHQGHDVPVPSAPYGPVGGYPPTPNPHASYSHTGFPLYQDYYGVTNSHGVYPLDPFHQFDLGDRQEEGFPASPRNSLPPKF